jgi:hypothetical protein
MAIVYPLLLATVIVICIIVIYLSTVVSLILSPFNRMETNMARAVAVAGVIGLTWTGHLLYKNMCS